MALACTASIPTPWWPCCHAALRGGGKWRETDKPCSGWGERSPVPPRYGESLVGGGTAQQAEGRPCRHGCPRPGPGGSSQARGAAARLPHGASWDPHGSLWVPASQSGAGGPWISPRSDLSPGRPGQAPGQILPPGNMGPSQGRGRKRRLGA